MTKVRIYRPPDGVADEEALRELLAEAGCEVEEEAIPDEDEECPVAPPLIVVLTPNLADDPQLEAVLDEAERNRSRIIGIWPKGSAGEGAAPTAFDLGDDSVEWDPARVREAVGAPPQPVCETPEGKPRESKNGPHKSCN